jgi:RNA polymerase sigma factor (sigma-70 family)
MGARIADALRAAMGVPVGLAVVVPTGPDLSGPLCMSDALPLARPRVRINRHAAAASDVDALVVRLFQQEGRSLVRLVRLFVDDRNAAEDLVQEGFIRLARSAHRIQDESKAAAYLRSIVLNLARDHNRRGLVSLRHHLPGDDDEASTEDQIVLRDDQQHVIDVLRDIPHRQRDCLVLRYYDELGIEDIAATLGISPNSVKTHLKRGLVAMEARLGVEVEAVGDGP